MTNSRFSSQARSLACLLVSGLLVVAVAGCASTTDRWASQLPEIASDNAVTLTGRSILNVSEIQHEHILYVDGILAGKFKNDQVKTYQIPAGPKTLTLTCHTSVVSGSVDQPFNYNRPAGKTKMEIDTQPGDELCLKITYGLTNCAVLEDADPSYCLREF